MIMLDESKRIFRESQKIKKVEADVLCHAKHDAHLAASTLRRT